MIWKLFLKMTEVYFVPHSKVCGACVLGRKIKVPDMWQEDAKIFSAIEP